MKLKKDSRSLAIQLLGDHVSRSTGEGCRVVLKDRFERIVTSASRSWKSDWRSWSWIERKNKEPTYDLQSLMMVKVKTEDVVEGTALIGLGVLEDDEKFKSETWPWIGGSVWVSRLVRSRLRNSNLYLYIQLTCNTEYFENVVKSRGCYWYVKNLAE